MPGGTKLTTSNRHWRRHSRRMRRSRPLCPNQRRLPRHYSTRHRQNQPRIQCEAPRRVPPNRPLQPRRANPPAKVRLRPAEVLVRTRLNPRRQDGAQHKASASVDGERCSSSRFETKCPSCTLCALLNKRASSSRSEREAEVEQGAERVTCDNKGQNAATTSTACAVCDGRGMCIVEPVSTEKKRKGDGSGVYQDIRESAS